ncbi:LysE family translocator [Bowmanella dokdonensis]|uniref:LysE family translocator n=1 Tax=Bowmanella dokdonensis TaxID=751969 RepID=A0A939DP78_9ALTE|nr:LysE family translocator [Bowmanella dokdonensis]MBN7826220.1 LysE family translocator [Bowmanella dokdonensis]
MEWLALFLFVVSASITPGPNNLMMLTSGVNHGILRSLPHMIGINIGFPLMVLAVGLGMAGLFENYPVLHQVLKWAGASYLLFLAWKIASSPVTSIQVEARKPFSFVQAALFQWVNPKAWMMVLGAVVTYTSSQMDYQLQVGIIALFFLLFGTPCTFTWLWLGSRMQSLLRTPGRLRCFNIAMAILLAASLIPVLTDNLSG